jgi:hypothetical protein
VGAACAEELRLADGRAPVLAGVAAVELPDPGTSVALIDPQAVSIDRHGRVRGQLRGSDGAWLQASLVERGLALVAPAGDVAPEILAELLRLEREARGARRGLWGGDSPPPLGADRVAAEPGAFVLVGGTVRDVVKRHDFTYLDFGEDWRRDFTVRAETRQLAAFARDGLDVEGLAGKRILVRGYLFENAGPMIELVHLAQIEVEE